MEKYVSDISVKSEKQDFFQRYGFAKRIAETIIHREVSDSIVIGIYGDWGEGKSSVLNFIEDNLINSPEIVVCKFNPWRFNDETQLLIGFFNMLATELKRSIKSKSKKIGEFISKYAETIIPDISFFGGVVKTNPGSLIKKIAAKCSKLDIEKQKERIEKILEEEKKKVVIFIDDIDRLDKKEIQAIFKLVKLTGDFAFTSYILAFDDKMVAKAIGEIYESGDEQAGKNYLEKIIQVPLRLPLAQKDALKKFCFNKIDNAIHVNDIEISKDEAQRFWNNFTKSILPYITTPRMVIRYCNAISFSLPLLYKEVNTVDLLFIEAIKVFFPELYDFIRTNSEYFIKPYSTLPIYRSGYSDNSENVRKEKSKKEINNLLGIYSDNDNLLNLLLDLFPVLKEIYKNFVHGEQNHKEWYRNKRIGSPYYFKRYFSYTVIEGEISDIAFDGLLDYVNTHSDSTNQKFIELFLMTNDPQSFISKLRWKEDKYSSKFSEKLIMSLSKLGEYFPSDRNSLFGFDSPLRQLVYFIYNLFSNITDHEVQLKLIEEVIKECTPTKLSIELLLNFQQPQKESVFSNEELKKIGEILLDRLIDETQDIPLFEKFEEDVSYIFTYLWLPIKGKEIIMDYIKPILDKNPDKINNLLKCYAPFIHSTHQPDPYYGDFRMEDYEKISKTYDVDYLYQTAIKAFGEQIDIKTYQRLDNSHRDEDRIKQFVYFYKVSKGELTCESYDKSGDYI